MRLQELFHQIDMSKAKLVRHNLSSSVVNHNYVHGYLDIYQTIQTPKRFANSEYILSFLGIEGTEGRFLGCYKIVGTEPFSPEHLPPDFMCEKDMTVESQSHIVWKMEKVDVWSELIDRLVIDWGKATLSWCQNATNDKEVLYILPAVADIQFVSYERALLPFDRLQTIISNNKTNKEWEDKLSAVAGIYLITDTKTGKQYVGSASGEQGGIWGRWAEYAKTKHGGNKRLKELIAADPDHCKHFQFSILDVFPIKKDKHDVLKCEQLYKQKLCTVQFGLNDN